MPLVPQTARRVPLLALLLLALSLLSACWGDASPPPPRQGSGAPDGLARPARPDFDGAAFCGGQLMASAIPKGSVAGALAKHGEDELSLDFELVSGRAEIKADRVALSFAAEELKTCSGARADGKRSTAPRINLVLSELKVGTYRFPDSERGTFKYWNYLYITDKGTPFTMNAQSREDGAILVVESVDEAQKLVRGKVAVCKKKGAGGWVAGAFEVPVCD